MTATTLGARPRLISFPDPVNEVSARLVATGVVIMAVATVAFDQPWILVALVYGFLARVLTGPRLSPLGQLVTRVVVPRLPLAVRPYPGPPKRFAQGMGLAFSTTSGLLVLLGYRPAAWAVLGLLIVAASLEAFAGYCLGCKTFALLMRFGIIPEDVCERCNDIWARPAA
ncbi:MAG: DUF4395 domain-containing protein [Acidimicrobiales bacterium]